jgi:hypothetical protein
MISPFIPTIIITVELHAEIRGYPLLGREFILKEPLPRKECATTLDGEEVVDDFWVVTKEEYIRICPEAQYQKLEGDVILIPTFIAQPSFRPCYIK